MDRGAREGRHGQKADGKARYSRPADDVRVHLIFLSLGRHRLSVRQTVNGVDSRLPTATWSLRRCGSAKIGSCRHSGCCSVGLRVVRLCEAADPGRITRVVTQERFEMTNIRSAESRLDKDLKSEQCACQIEPRPFERVERATAPKPPCLSVCCICGGMFHSPAWGGHFRRAL